MTLVVVLALGGPAVAGCTSSTGPPPGPPAGPATSTGATGPSRPDRTGEVQAVLARMVAAARGKDATAYRATVTNRDPAFVARSEQWWRTIGAIEWAVLELRPVAGRADLAPARQRLLGPEAWTQQVEVDWRSAGASRTARQRVWLSFAVVDGGIRVAGWDERPAGTSRAAVPGWLLEPVTAARAGSTVVLVAAGRPARAWLARAERAAADVRAHVPAALRAGGAAGLLVQVPSTRAAFERLLGVAPGSYADVAAAAWPLGPDPATAALQVVVNPEIAARLDADALAVLLAHEATHVAVGSPGSPAPTWLVEGYADRVAYAAHPRTRAAAARPALDRVRADGPPRSLPSDAAFDGSAAELDVAYAQAWLLCLFIAERHGDDRLARLYRAAAGGQQVDRSIRTTLGTSRPALVADAGRALRRWTTDPPW